RHTRWPRDWSSDVCSSDLHAVEPGSDRHGPGQIEREPARTLADLAGDRFRPLHISPGDDDRVSPAYEALGHGPADPGCSTDDHRLATFAHAAHGCMLRLNNRGDRR